MAKTINAKELRNSLPEVVRRVRQGESFTVIYRSRPAFRLVPLTGLEEGVAEPLEQDALYHAEAVGESSDGLTSAEHDELLYGGPKR